MTHLKIFFKLSIISLLIPLILFGQSKKKKEAYEFTMVNQVQTTPVKNQSKTGTWWSFATTSFIETELLRRGKGEHILSPMWFVRFAYPSKAEKYLRYHGQYNFGVGGQAHDVTNVVKQFGFVPEEFYKGMNRINWGFVWNITQECFIHNSVDPQAEIVSAFSRQSLRLSGF